MQNVKAKVLSVFMSLIMVVTLFPALNSYAAEPTSGTCGVSARWTLNGDTLNISGSGDIDNYEMYTNGSTSAPWNGSRYKVKNIVVGAGITRIGNNAFAYLTNLVNVQFKGTAVKSIGVQSFARCYALKSIDLPAGLVSVGKNCFRDGHLVSVTFPTSLKTIAYAAFANNDLVKVYIPAGVTVIGDFAFRGNYKLVKFTGGAGVVTIGIQAFEHCYKLSNFVITSKKLKKIGKACFLCDSKLKTLYIKQTTKLTKKGVKNSLYLSSVKKVKVKKSKVKKYKKYFTYRNCAKRGVKVKK